MGAVPFDTPKLARGLEGTGFAPRQAGDTAEALAEAMSGAELTTTADVARLRGESKAAIAAGRGELKAEIAVGTGRDRVAAARPDDPLGSMTAVTVGILLAAIRYLPASH
jgi:hypothetical protein